MDLTYTKSTFVYRKDLQAPARSKDLFDLADTEMPEPEEMIAQLCVSLIIFYLGAIKNIDLLIQLHIISSSFLPWPASLSNVAPQDPSLSPRCSFPQKSECEEPTHSEP